MKTKKAAIELSIGTIVIIVLAMAMLMGGLVLVKNIFSGSDDIINMQRDEMIKQVQDLYGEEKDVAVLPSSGIITVKQGKDAAFGIVIRNIRSGANSDSEFSYTVEVSDSEVATKCSGATKADIEKLIVAGRSIEPAPIATGGSFARQVRFQTDKGDPICLVSFVIQVERNGQPYATEFMDVNFKG